MHLCLVLFDMAFREIPVSVLPFRVVDPLVVEQQEIFLAVLFPEYHASGRFLVFHINHFQKNFFITGKCHGTILFFRISSTERNAISWPSFSWRLPVFIPIS